MKRIALTTEEIGSMCLALSHFFHAGIPTGEALALLLEEETHPGYRGLLQSMAQQADEGIALSVILKNTGCFPAYVSTLVAVGEKTGKVEEALAALSQYYTQQAQRKQQLRTSLLYPAALLAVLIAVTVILLVWVMPVFAQVYGQLGITLTGTAGWLLALGQGLGQALPGICLFLGLLLIFFLIPGLRKPVLQLWQNRRGHRGVYGSVNTARFVQGLSMAVNSGMTAQEAALLGTSLSDSKAFRAQCQTCLKALDKGHSLPRALGEAELLTPADRRLLESGIRSGQTASVISDLATRLAERSQAAIDRLVGWIEPLMVAAACILIGGVLLSVLVPLANLMQAIG